MHWMNDRIGTAHERTDEAKALKTILLPKRNINFGVPVSTIYSQDRHWRDETNDDLADTIVQLIRNQDDAKTVVEHALRLENY
jgi:hypothetical protein